MLDVAHGRLASAKFMVDVDLVLCFSTLHISVWSVGEISTWYQWASWFVEKILHGIRAQVIKEEQYTRREKLKFVVSKYWIEFLSHLFHRWCSIVWDSNMPLMVVQII